MMKIICACAVSLASACHAQLPNSPGAVKAFALNVGLDTRYSFTTSTREAAPRLGVDYRISPQWRVGLAYSHPVMLTLPPAVPGKPPAPRQSNSITLSLNFKIYQVGKPQ